MGVVYRATDSKLKREVAIKVLPEAFAADAERLARFEREAQLLAQLHHPNIASIYGLEESSGVRALVMELVEGEDLAERLKRGAAPVRRGARRRPPDRRGARGGAREGDRPPRPQARQREAHAGRQGQGPRLRPRQGDGPARGLRLRGRPRALADAHELADDDGRARHAARRHPRHRGLHGARAGARRRGRQARRHLGVRRRPLRDAHRPLALRGRHRHDTLAGVLKNEIDLAALPAGTPPALRRLLRRCLERNPKNRLHDIADARIVLDDLVAGRTDSAKGRPGAQALPPREAEPGRPCWPWVGAGLLLGAARSRASRPHRPRAGARRASDARLPHLQRKGIRSLGVPRRQDDRLHFDARRPLAHLAETARDRRRGGAHGRAVRLDAPVLARRQHPALPARVRGTVRALPRPDRRRRAPADRRRPRERARPGLPTAAASP